MRRFECSAILFELDAVLVTPGADRVLGALPPGSWAVVTSGPRASAAARLGRAGLPQPGVLIGAEEVRRGMPDPLGYLRAAEALGVVPGRCLVVDGAPASLEAARAAGMTALGVSTTHPGPELAAAVLVPDLTRVYLGRIERESGGSWRLEVLVVEASAPLGVPRPFAPVSRR
jgi:sugar-phosphatase